MATVTYIRESKQSISAMKGVIDYCCQDKKVYDEISNQRLVIGINCDGENAFKEFMATKKSYGKTDGMNFYQYVQSFSPEENITPHQALEIAIEFAEKAWTGDRKYITYQCPNKMKCRDIKLHNDKYLKGSMENEFRYRQEQYFGKSKTKEQQLLDSDRTAIGRNESDFDSVTGQRGGTQSVENRNNLSAGAVQLDFKNLNRRPDSGISGENSGNQQRQYENNLTELSGGVEDNFETDSERHKVSANADDRINQTGWEESRAVFEQYLAARSGVGIINSITSEEVNSANNHKMDSDNRTILGGVNSLAESLSRIIDDESEDEEERRKRIVAEQNGSDIGTLLGLTAGLIAGAIRSEERR